MLYQNPERWGVAPPDFSPQVDNSLVVGFEPMADGDWRVGPWYSSYTQSYDPATGTTTHYSGSVPKMTHFLTKKTVWTGIESFNTTGTITIIETVDAETGKVTTTGSGCLVTGPYSYEFDGQEVSVYQTLYPDGHSELSDPRAGMEWQWYALWTTDVFLSDTTPFKYWWWLPPTAACYLKLWWKEVGILADGSTQTTPKTLELLPGGNVSVNGYCVPDKFEFLDKTTWKKGDEYTTDFVVEIQSLRYSALPGYDPTEKDNGPGPYLPDGYPDAVT